MSGLHSHFKDMISRINNLTKANATNSATNDGLHSIIFNPALDTIGSPSAINTTKRNFKSFTKDDLITHPRAPDGHLIPAEPLMDGINHICVNFHGKTQCGKMMSNFYQCEFEHPYFGKFQNMEAFWQWLKSTSRPDCLRSMRAKEAKALGKTLTKRVVPFFYETILDANYHRVLQTPHILDEVIRSTLPFDFYYLHQSSGIPIHPNDREKQIFHFELLRKWVKGEGRPNELNYKQVLHD